ASSTTWCPACSSRRKIVVFPAPGAPVSTNRGTSASFNEQSITGERGTCGATAWRRDAATLRGRFADDGLASSLSASACSWDCTAWHSPPSRLAGYPGDQVVVAVVVHDGAALSLRHRGDQQDGEADHTDPAAAPQSSLDLQGSVPVLIVSGQPLVT